MPQAGLPNPAIEQGEIAGNGLASPFDDVSAFSLSLHAGASFGPAAVAAIDVARLLVVFPSPHLFFDATVLDRLAKPPDGVRDGLILT